ncbi:MAG: Glutathione S-transferase, N-terminal domain [Rhodospirillales bacterium]|nr:Glutathione S-transferase, N-terminal domain [Rhodospirillales bacterium]
MYQLFGRRGWGSVLAEAQLAWYALPYKIEEVDDLFASEAARERLAKVNPVAQLPTLVMPDGSVMTESAAITLYLAEITNGALVPPPRQGERPRFLRWLVFLVTNIYPTFTYSDDPSRFVTGEAAQMAFRESVDDYAKRLWHIVEQEAGAPWFLGEDFSALDIYIAAMTHWRPRRGWFAEHCPRLTAIALAADAQPKLQHVWERNFPGSANPA